MPIHLKLGGLIGDAIEYITPSLPGILGGLFGRTSQIGTPIIAQPRSLPPTVFPGMGGAGALGGLQMASNLGPLDLLPEWAGGTPGAVVTAPQAPRRGGISMGGVAPGFFHATPTGRVLPNSRTLATDPLGNLAFFVHAGKPTHFSKIGRYPKRRHHHGHPRHHRHPR